MFGRVAPRLELLEERFQKDSSVWQKRLAETQFVVMPGQFVGQSINTSDIFLKLFDEIFSGQSTCNNFTSALGAGQKVLSYAYYRPYIVATRE